MNRQFSAYRDWVREQNCVECGEVGISEVHHLKGDFHQSGAGMKAPDYLAMPLCHRCHRTFHDQFGFDQKELQREWLIKTLILAFEYGEICVKE